MKRLVSILLVVMTVLVGFSVVSQVQAEGLPESVQHQSRKDAIESDTWKKFDKAGQLKFLQIETTSPASAAGTAEKLDGSAGEALVEIKVDPALALEKVEWSIANKGKSDVWVVAVSKSEATVPLKIAPEASVTVSTALAEKYAYLVLDNETGKKANVEIKAKGGEVEAKTTEGKTVMSITWF